MGKYDAFLNGEIDEPIAGAPSKNAVAPPNADGIKNPDFAAFLNGDDVSPGGDRTLGRNWL